MKQCVLVLHKPIPFEVKFALGVRGQAAVWFGRWLCDRADGRLELVVLPPVNFS